MMHYVSDAAMDKIQERINSAAVDELLLQVSNGDTNIPSEDVYPMLVLMEMGRLMGYRQGALETLKTLGIEGVDDVISF